MEIIREFPEQYLYPFGLWIAIQLAVLSLLGSLGLGTLIALFRVSPVPPLRWLGAGYVEFFRNTPLLVQLFFLYFATPYVGIYLGSNETFAFNAAVLGLTLYHAAYVGEVVRGGLLGVAKGQIEAARSLGLS
jgi:putative glutamine transport system permease protein